ncbi:hypothetical protein PIB30_026307 [Stylosanthes scabra]|uniref:Uncharacterized protein n=1 Tax=Stylosanthes scabra TaxID=79078 RepID=A0ABU6W8A1_9FABA|nr:hypothetical protein [Stylosanthes scabra]
MVLLIKPLAGSIDLVSGPSPYELLSRQSELKEVSAEEQLDGLHAISETIPEFNLEDKVVLEEEGNDTSMGKEENTIEEHAVSKENSVTIQGQVEHDPNIEGCRKSNRMKVKSKRLEEIGI